MKINPINFKSQHPLIKRQVKNTTKPINKLKYDNLAFGAFDKNKVQIFRNQKKTIEPYEFAVKISDDEVYSLFLTENSTQKYLYNKNNKLDEEQKMYFTQTIGYLMVECKKTKTQNIQAVNDFLDLTNLTGKDKNGVLQFSDFTTREILKKGLEDQIIDNSDKLTNDEVEEIIGIVQTGFDFLKQNGGFDFKNLQNGLAAAYIFYDLCKAMNIEFISVRAQALKETILEESKDKNGNINLFHATLMLELMTSLANKDDEDLVKSASNIVRHFKNNGEDYAGMINFANEFKNEIFEKSFINAFDSQNDLK